MGETQTGMPQQPQTRWKYLKPKPGSMYRQLFIGRIAARVLYGAHLNEEEPRTAKEIAEDYNLPLEAVEEAIAYCSENPPEVELDYQIEQALMEATGMNDPNYKNDPKGTYRMLSPQERGKIVDEVVRRFQRP